LSGQEELLQNFNALEKVRNARLSRSTLAISRSSCRAHHQCNYNSLFRGRAQSGKRAQATGTGLDLKALATFIGRR
jgi:hypothetical protein